MKELCCIQKLGWLERSLGPVLVACLQGVSVSECGLWAAVSRHVAGVYPSCPLLTGGWTQVDVSERPGLRFLLGSVCSPGAAGHRRGGHQQSISWIKAHVLIDSRRCIRAEEQLSCSIWPSFLSEPHWWGSDMSSAIHGRDFNVLKFYIFYLFFYYL